MAETLIPKETFGHDLEVVEVYDFYDKPCLFSFRDVPSKTFFLALAVDESDKGEVYLYVVMSPERFEAVCNGKLDLHDAFLKAESGRVVTVLIPSDAGSPWVEQIPCDRLTDEWLPSPGEMLIHSNISEIFAPSVAMLESIAGWLKNLVSEARWTFTPAGLALLGSAQSSDIDVPELTTNFEIVKIDLPEHGGKIRLFDPEVTSSPKLQRLFEYIRTRPIYFYATVFLNQDGEVLSAREEVLPRDLLSIETIRPTGASKILVGLSPVRKSLNKIVEEINIKGRIDSPPEENVVFWIFYVSNVK